MKDLRDLDDARCKTLQTRGSYFLHSSSPLYAVKISALQLNMNGETCGSGAPSLISNTP